MLTPGRRFQPPYGLHQESEESEESEESGEGEESEESGKSGESYRNFESIVYSVLRRKWGELP